MPTARRALQKKQFFPPNRAVHAHRDPIKGAKAYVPAWFSGLEPSANEGDWRTNLPFSKSRGDLKNLPSNRKAWVKIRAIGSGAENIGPWSDPISVPVP